MGCSMSRTPLVYVQPFKVLQKSAKDADINMFSVSRAYRGNNSRKSSIVPLNHVWRPIELIPKFGEECDRKWTFDSAVELARYFYVNCFSDKQTYIEVY